MSDLPPLDDAELEQLLADQSVWIEPPTGLEDLVVDAIERAASANVTDLATTRKRRRLTTFAPWIATAVAAAFAVLFAVHPLQPQPAHQFAAVLGGTELAPTAHGTADFETKASGVEIRLAI